MGRGERGGRRTERDSRENDHAQSRFFCSISFQCRYRACVCVGEGWWGGGAGVCGVWCVCVCVCKARDCMLFSIPEMHKSEHDSTGPLTVATPWRPHR